MARAPLDRMLVTPHGGYNFHRTHESAPNIVDAGEPGYYHHGVDLAASEGTPVYAPENGFLLYAVDGNAVKPFSRFGPAVVVIAGGSGKHHLLAHLAAPPLFGPFETADIPPRAQRLSTPLRPAYRAYGGGISDVPGNRVLMPMVPVQQGQLVGYVGSPKHLHWEVRDDGADRDSHHDPLAWLKGNLHSEGQTGPPIDQSDDDDNSGLLLLLAALAFFWDS